MVEQNDVSCVLDKVAEALSSDAQQVNDQVMHTIPKSLRDPILDVFRYG